ncbi:MAG: aldo/keto reductase [Herbinix sp.]|nr:aldo/keto reductase [Herbinix sp.]
MKYLKYGKKLEMSQVIAGMMRLNDAAMEGDTLLNFVEKCIDMGIDSFDHAPVYGGYKCEKIFGDNVLRKKPELRNKMKLVTKTGIVLPGVEGNKRIYYKSTKEEISKEMDKSLSNLGTDYVDLLLVHRPDILGNPEETADALETLVKEGKVLNVGVSNYTPSQMKVLQSYLTIPLVTNQMELSVAATYNFENGVVDDAFIRRIPLMAWSPLGGGSIFQNNDEKSERIRTELKEIAEAHNATIDSIMYAWLFRHPVGIAAVTGTMNIDRIRTAVKALSIILSYEEWYTILAASRGYDVP